MGCLTSKTPLDPKSWQFRGGFFLNAGDSGMDWCNNHTHLIEYKGTRYILHHTLHIQERMKTRGGFRCMCVDLLPYTDTEFPVTKATRKGVTQTQPLDPYKAHSGAEMFTCADMWYEQISTDKMAVKSLAEGAWTYIKGVDFGKGTEKLLVTAKGMGVIELRLDDRNSEPLGVIELANDGFDKIPVVLPTKITGIHNVYFAFSSKDICLERWQAE